MPRLFRLFLLPPLLAVAAAVQLAHAQERSEEEEAQSINNLLRGYMLAASGKHAQAARLIGEIGIEEQDGKILASAVRSALQAKDVRLALKYARVWAQVDGGVQSRQTMAELHLLNNAPERAEPLLAALMQNGEQASEDLLHQLRAVKNAATALAMGRRLFPPDGDGFYHLALLALIHRQEAEAGRIAARARRAAPERLDILFLSAQIAQRVEGDAAPLPLLRAFAKGGCAKALRHCTLDGVLWAFSDYLRRGEDWREGLNAKRADTPAWAVSAGNWYEQWEMPAEARAAYGRAGGVFAAQLGLARLAQADGDSAAALRILQKAEVANSGELARRETTIAHLLSEQGQEAEALARIKTAQTTVPKNFSLMYHESLLLEGMGEVQEALAVLRNITQLFPDNADGWNALGYVMADHNIQLQDARGYIEHALSISPDAANIIDSLGWVLYRLGDLPRARLQLQRAAELSSSAEIHAHYGEVLWEMGEKGEAQRIWESARAREPDNKVLNETIARYRGR